MLTLFTIPKPFQGHIGDIQRNAIESWRALEPQLQIVLVGDEEGVEQAARSAAVEHVGNLATNERGTPRLDNAFELVETIAAQPLRCLVNADVVLLEDFLPAVRRVASTFEHFAMVGECRDLDVEAGLRLVEPGVRAKLREEALARGRLRGWAALDYFVFPPGEFGDVPPFLIGRACFDNWLVWRVRQQGHPVVDATRSIVAVHQSHDYGHVAGGFDEAYYGEEARYNERLAGGREHIYSLHDATHRLYKVGPPLRYWGSTFRAREKARVARARLEARRARRSSGRPLRVLGVFPQPQPETTRLLDALVELRDNIDLTVLYATEPPRSADGSAGLLEHSHWFPRSVRLPRLDRALGREYPINWAIWRSFLGFRPDCMLLSDLGTFASQAAILWCTGHRIPYVLLSAEGASNEAGRDGFLGRFASSRAAGVVPADAPTREVAEVVRRVAASSSSPPPGPQARWTRKLPWV